MNPHHVIILNEIAYSWAHGILLFPSQTYKILNCSALKIHNPEPHRSLFSCWSNCIHNLAWEQSCSTHFHSNTTITMASTTSSKDKDDSFYPPVAFSHQPSHMSHRERGKIHHSKLTGCNGESWQHILTQDSNQFVSDTIKCAHHYVDDILVILTNDKHMPPFFGCPQGWQKQRKLSTCWILLVCN